jgi:hypothetical protein
MVLKMVFMAKVQARTCAVFTSASGVVLGGSSSVEKNVAGVCGTAVPRRRVGEVSKRVTAGWESMRGQCCAKN